MERAQFELLARIQERHWFYRHRARLLEEHLRAKLTAPAAILDFGAGTGANVPVLERFGQVTCVERDAWAADRIRARHPGVQVATESLEELAMREDWQGRFDVIIVSYVLYHEAVKDPLEALRLLSRLARPGALLVNFEPAFESLRRGLDRAVHSARRFEPRALESIHRDAGWEPEGRRLILPSLFPAAWALARAERESAPSPEAPMEQRRAGNPWINASMRAWLALVDRPLAALRAPFGIGVLLWSRRKD